MTSSPSYCGGTLPLTERQEQLWRFIASCERSPTYEEMADELGTVVGAQISKLIAALEERGFIRRIPGKSRSVIALSPHLRQPLDGYSDEELAGELDRRSGTPARLTAAERFRAAFV